MANNEIVQRGFFEVLYRGQEGYLCIATKTIGPDGKPTIDHRFFSFPQEVPKAVAFANSQSKKLDVYFCVNLSNSNTSIKQQYISTAGCVWADLDECPPDAMLIQPTIALQTSPGRYQALWFLQQPVEADQAEHVSRRVAYHHAPLGADRSGWDKNQLLRVPFTYNHKYESPQLVTFSLSRPSNKYTLEDFSVYPQIIITELETKLPFPDGDSTLDRDGADILEEYETSHKINNPIVHELFHSEPDSDWSRELWKLELLLFEYDVPPIHVYVIARDSACNKYNRDSRRNRELWRDVLRAKAYVEDRQTNPVAHRPLPKARGYSALLSESEQSWAATRPHFVNDYISWASSSGDAAVQYHQAGAFIILSAVLSAGVKLPTSTGTIVPNLWFLILADTTLTRKSTAMTLALNLLYEVDDEIVLATDGSVEGMLSQMEDRRNRPSLFVRDEFTGFMEAVTHKDYLSGMLETLTLMYDGQRMKRVLRKETYDIRDPIFLIFGGGIKSRIVELLKPEHVMSGFLPRFVIITAEADSSRFRPLGPPSDEQQSRRGDLIDRCVRMAKFYTVREPKVQPGGKVVKVPKVYNASLTPGAWQRLAQLEHVMIKDSENAMFPEIVMPTMARLHHTGLKAALLISAAREEQDDVVVTEDDLIHAFFFVEQWRDHALSIIEGLGLSSEERLLQQVVSAIQRSPHISRAELMRRFRLNNRTADMILTTIEQRGLAKKAMGVQKGKATGARYIPMEV